MAKRKLTGQQIKRVEQHHHATEQGSEFGILISHFGKKGEIYTRTGERLECGFRQNLPDLAVGDHLLFLRKERVILAQLPRTNILKRQTYFGEKLLAANIDQWIMTFAIEPRFELLSLDMYLASAETSKVSAVIVINKIDLAEDLNSRQSFFKYYEALGYPVLWISVDDKRGLKELAAELSHQISIFVGPSGVGKSSLIQALLPQETLKIGEISEGSQLGKHTTTTSRFYPCDQGGIIDSPGIRDFTPVLPERQNLQASFRDLARFAQDCQFRNCAHDHEPGCAVKLALENGSLLASRFESFLKLKEKLS